MLDYLAILASYVPPAVARYVYHNPKAPEIPQAERFEAAVLFADVSGFTALTETLANQGPAGSEEITGLLNKYFGRMILLAEAEGGEVVKFSGDGLTVVFPARDETLPLATRRAYQAARQMQLVSSYHFSGVETRAGKTSLAMRISIGAGPVLAASVGGVQGHWEYVIAGDAVQQAAAAGVAAPVNEILLSPEAQSIVADQTLTPRSLDIPTWSTVAAPREAKVALEAYVPASITYRLSAGQADFLAELRRMSIVFVNIGRLDYGEAGIVERLHTFVQTAQGIINHYEGTINKLAVDDKGTVLLALFGAPPYAHEDDPERATRCALDLQLATGPDLSLAVGVSTGRVFVGPFGGASRREYTVMGDKVNLAARLMSAAQEDSLATAGGNQKAILCDDDTFRAASAHLTFETLLPIQVKGKTGHIPVHRPRGHLSPLAPLEVQDSQFVGRTAERQTFIELLAEVEQGKSRVLLLEGEAGIGKSRLVQEMIEHFHQKDVCVLFGEGQSLEQQTPLRAWRDIFTAYFDLENLPVEGQAGKRARLLSCLEELDPGLVERAPLLNDLVGLTLPDTHLTRFMDASLRHESLTALLVDLLRHRAGETPLILILEDAHWLDTLSWELVLAVAQYLSPYPLFLIVVMRPFEGEFKPLELKMLAEMPNAASMHLQNLSAQEVVALAASRLGVTAANLPPEVVTLIKQRADGNPFFAEELVYALRDSGVIRVVEAEAADGRRPGHEIETAASGSENGTASRHCKVVGNLEDLVLPDTLQGVIVSRIDRLQPDAQLALKVAAVIGRTFTYRTLYNVISTHTDITDHLLKARMDELVQLDLTPLESQNPELSYFFKHIITREVAYDLLLFAQRRDLHRTVASWYENTYGAGPELRPHYSLLVYHWRQAEDRDKERYYCHLAGRQAAERFANTEALAYFNRALELSADDPEFEYHLYAQREKVYDLLGDREKQGDDLAEMTTLAELLKDDECRTQVFIRVAAYNEALSNYPAAIAMAHSALALARETGDKLAEVTSLNQWGTSLGMQGDFLGAREQFKRALNALPPGDDRDFPHERATTLHNLGNIDHQLGDYPAAEQSYDAALALWRGMGDRLGESRTLNNLGRVYTDQGDYANALKHQHESLDIKTEIGYLSGEAQSLNNLGAIHRDLGNYADAIFYYERALSIERSLKNRRGEAMNLNDLGLIYHLTGDSITAEDYCRQAQVIARDIGDPQVEGRAMTLIAFILEERGQIEPARELYLQALHLRLETKQLAVSVTNQAGLARCALAQEDLEAAYDRADNCATWLTVQGPVGLEDPLQVYVTCHQVFTAVGHPEKARSILSYAHTIIQNRAAKIRDEVLRASFFTNLPYNRFILDAWAEYQGLLADLDDDFD
ncbi:MAG: tetratricopeptide repeat protein [Anaerolineae bacterium]